MSSLPWVSYLLSAAVASVGCKPAPSLQVLGESTRLAEGEPSPRMSAIFDGKVLRLRGARGETLGVSLRISDGKARRVRLELPESARVNAFSVRSLEVKEASTDLYGESRGAGRYPDILTPVAGIAVTATKQAYFDVVIADQANPGRYEGALLVSGQRFPVTLEVSSARIDLAREPLVWVFYLPSEVAKAHGLPDDDTPALLAKESLYHDLFRAHGAFLAADLPPSRFEARRRFMHDVAYWPVAIDISSDQAIERDVERWLELFRGTAVTPFTIPVDEPHTIDARLRARHIAEVIRRAGGGRPRLLCAVTDAWSPIYGDSMDVYLSPANFPNPASTRAALGERFWTYNGRAPAAGSLILDTDGVALRTWGWIAERYDVPLWHAWEGLYFSDRYNHGVTSHVLQNPLTFDERRHGGSDFGNGDGILVYPGPLPSLRLKALRRGLEDRMLLRELAKCGGADQARRIVRRMVPRALGEGQANGSGRRAKGTWSLDESVWESARLQVLDAIERECHEQPALAH